MEILFIHKGSKFEILGPMIISSVLKESGFSTTFLDVEEGINTIKKRILHNNQNCILAYSMPTVCASDFLHLNREIKSLFPTVLSLFGGPHPTFFPEIIEEDGVDGVCIGEGEYAMLELVKNFSEGRSISGIRNWWIKRDSRIYRNPLRPLIEDLDELPFADRTPFSSLFFKRRIARIIISRGCPYQCSFCFNHAFNRLYNNSGIRVRYRTVDNLIKEAKQLKTRFTLKGIIFIDDIFILDRHYLEEFADKYKKEVNLPFRCHIRADLVTPQIISLLKKAGCRWINMGIECADDYLRNCVLKKSLDKEAIIRAARLIKNEGISLRATNILGIPGASLNTDIETLKLNIKCRVDDAGAWIFSAYPKTEIYSFAQKYNLISEGLESISMGAMQYLKRRYKNEREKRRLENLTCLFSSIASFPFLLPFVKILIELPLTIAYSKLFALSYDYKNTYYKPPRTNQGGLLKRLFARIKI